MNRRGRAIFPRKSGGRSGGGETYAGGGCRGVDDCEAWGAWEPDAAEDRWWPFNEERCEVEIKLLVDSECLLTVF